MKTLHPALRSFSQQALAAIIAFSWFGLNASAAPQSGPVAAAPTAATGAPAANIVPNAPPPAAPEEDILDIRGPIHLPAPFPWIAWSTGVIGAAGVGLAAWAFLRRARSQQPYEIALAKLEKLRALMQQENAHDFSLAVSEIVRGFIEECLPVRAAHRTTNEFLHDLLKMPGSGLAEQSDALEDFLTHCDLAKFARWSLTVPQMEAMLTSARGVVFAVGQPKSAPLPSAVVPPVTAATPAIANS